MATLCSTTFCYNITYKSNPYRLLPQVYPTMPSRKMIQARPVKLLPLRSLDLDGCWEVCGWSPSNKSMGSLYWNHVHPSGWIMSSLSSKKFLKCWAMSMAPSVLSCEGGDETMQNHANKQNKYVQFPFYHGLCHCSAGKRRIFVAKLICLPQVSAPKVPASC